MPQKIVTDEKIVIQIIRNFISNAIKFTENGSINFLIDCIENTLILSVSDTGIGLTKSHQQEIFDSFKQIDGALNRKYTGTGLGLAISKNLAKLLGGEITVSSELGQGSIFSLHLPMNN